MHPTDTLASLSDRERTVATLFARGMTYRDIGQSLFIAPGTVRTHLAAIYRKLGVGTKVGLARLVAEAEPVPSEAPGGPPARIGIAVLPFVNLGEGSGHDYFSDGITEDLITDLSTLAGLSVVGRHAIFAFRGRPIGLRELRDRFGVSVALEGSVRRDGRAVRVNAHLLDTGSGRHLWAGRFDGDLSDIFAVQDSIAAAIVEQMRVALLPGDRRPATAAATRSAEAYDHYLQGRHFYHLHTPAHAEFALRLFRKAVELDPAYARAYAGLADCLWFLHHCNHSDDGVDAVLSAARTALELDPGLPAAHASLATALHMAGRNAEAEASFERALDLDPDIYDTLYMYADMARNVGNLEKSVRLWRRAAEVDPADFRAPFILGQLLLDLGRPDEADAACRDGVERAGQAIAARPDVPLPLAMGAGALAALGQHERARQWIARALLVAPQDNLTLYNVACAHVLLGDIEPALDLLERWARRSNDLVRAWLRSDSDFDRLRGHPRFEALLAAMPHHPSPRLEHSRGAAAGESL